MIKREIEKKFKIYLIAERLFSLQVQDKLENQIFIKSIKEKIENI